MYFEAVVEFTTREARIELFNAFWQEFNPANCFLIQGNEAFMRIYLNGNEQPKNIIDAMSRCGIKMFWFEGSATDIPKNDHQQGGTADTTEEVTTDIPKNDHQQGGTANTTEEVTTDIPAAHKRRSKAEVDRIHRQIRESVNLSLDEIGEGAQNVDDFTSKISVWLGVEDKVFFANVVKTALGLQELTTKELHEVKGWTSKKYTMLLRSVRQAFEGVNKNVRFLHFIRGIVAYVNKNFTAPEGIEACMEESEEHAEDAEEQTEGVEEAEERTEDAETSTEPKRLKCLPDNPALNKALNSINFGKPPKLRLKRFFKMLDFETLVPRKPERSMIEEIISMALREQGLEGLDVTFEHWAALSYLVDKLAKGSEEQVKVEEFLAELRGALLTKEEVEKLS